MATSTHIKDSKFSNGIAFYTKYVIPALFTISMAIIGFAAVFFFNHTQSPGHTASQVERNVMNTTLLEIKEEIRLIRTTLVALQINHFTNKDADALERELRRYVDSKTE